MAAPLGTNPGTGGQSGLYIDDLPGGQASSDKGPVPETEAAPFSWEPKRRAAWYVDGFNLYHAIQRLDQPVLKWLDISGLARSYMQERHDLFAVNFFTALNTWDAEKRQRHVNYITALETLGVTVHRANFSNTTKYCRENDRYCKFKEEKQSDVGIAVRSLTDAHTNNIKEFFFLTADSDQIPTFHQLRFSFPDAKIMLIVPPGRAGEARDLSRSAHHTFDLSPGRLHSHVLPPSVFNMKGRTVATRPAHYAPHTKS